MHCDLVVSLCCTFVAVFTNVPHRINPLSSCVFGEKFIEASHLQEFCSNTDLVKTSYSAVNEKVNDSDFRSHKMDAWEIQMSVNDHFWSG